MIHTTTLQRLVFSVIIGLSGIEVAADPGHDDDKDKDHVTTIVGNHEAPAVSNILPWRSVGESTLSKDPIDSSVLHESLDPLDPETLHREIEFHQAMTGTATEGNH